MHKNFNAHVFETVEGYFLYDVNTDVIIKIQKDAFIYIKNIEYGITDDMETPHSVKQLEGRGYLKPNRVVVTEHPETATLRYHASNKIEGLILQVTQNCNLNCEYCAYSGSYYNRVHTNKRMTLQTAIKAVEFYLNRTKDINRLNIGFYGGEPLLEFELIRDVINYVNSNVEYKEIIYNITTNATLFNDEIIDFMIENNVKLMISLDGPREIHDKNRRFVNGRGSFDLVLKNITDIKDKNMKFYKENVSFNSVLETNRYNCVEQFFCKDKIFSKNTIMTSLVNDINAKLDFGKNEQYMKESKYSAFIAYLTIVNRIIPKKENPFNENFISSLSLVRKGKFGKQRAIIPKKWHHGGPCLPGVMRLFVDVEGTFFPCEKVSETFDDVIIGNLDKGFDFNKMDDILNIERKSEDQCHVCWAYSECNLCVGGIDTFENEESMKEKCKRIRREVEEDFKDYCALLYLGYDPDRGRTLGEW